MRLDKFLCSTGFGTRTEVGKIVRSKRVMVNNNIIISVGEQVDEEKDEIRVDGELVKYIKYIYIMLNKPEGFVSATVDNLHKTVIDLVPEYKHLNIFPVGRLDIDSTGLLLLTNNGNLSHNMLSPNRHVDKTYLVDSLDNLSPRDIKTLETGIMIDGKFTEPASVVKVKDYLYEVTIHEGMFHQVKKMFQYVGNRVISLQRISFGPLKLDEKLEEGSYRLLNDDEISLISEYM